MYATYLKKLSDQEKEIDALTAKQKKLMDDEFQAKKKVRGLPEQHRRVMRHRTNDPRASGARAVQFFPSINFAR